MAQLQERVQSLDQMNKSFMDDSIVQKIRIGQLEEDLGKARTEKQVLQAFYQSKIDVRIRSTSSPVHSFSLSLGRR